jgi:hypothetical protein
MPNSTVDPAKARLSIVFGAMADQIYLQIKRNRHGYMNLDLIRCCQQDADAVTRLKVRGLISDKSAHVARQRIMRNIQKAVERD